MDMAEHTLRILHLSDLHERGPREKEPWRRRRVLGDAWRANLEALLDDGPVDLVCFTGDAADWGQAQEYGPVTDFFMAALDWLHVPRERFFIVPGNHDIQRTVNADAWRRLRENLHRVPGQEVSRWLAGGPPPWGFDAADRDAVLARQGAYRQWLHGTCSAPTCCRMRRCIPTWAIAAPCGWTAGPSTCISSAWIPRGLPATTAMPANCASPKIR